MKNADTNRLSDISFVEKKVIGNMCTSLEAAQTMSNILIFIPLAIVFLHR